MFGSFFVCLLCPLHMISFSVVQSTSGVERPTERSESLELTEIFFYLDDDDDVTDTMSISQGMKFH